MACLTRSEDHTTDPATSAIFQSIVAFVHTMSTPQDRNAGGHELVCRSLDTPDTSHSADRRFISFFGVAAVRHQRIVLR